VKKLLLAAVCAVTLAPLEARADVAPDPDYVESCTLEKQRENGEECFECRASFQDPDACKQHAEGGFAPRCQTRGASVWTEIWCRVKPTRDEHPSDFAQPPPDDRPVELAAADPKDETVAAPEKHGCGACSIGAPSSIWGGLAASLASAMLLLRRRRRDG
jgi:LPXTG-motif cell wall-anchored protein